jgi:polyisoprenoid-binding protein YceI
MSKKVLIGLSVIVVMAVSAAAAYVLRTTAEASVPIEAVPVQVYDTPVETEDDPETTSQDDPTEAEKTDERSSEPAAEEAVMDQPVGKIIFTIVPEDSEVRFTLDELLRGNPTTVVGTTNQVAGEILIDIEKPGNSQVGTILINARTLVTDNEFRNRAIKNEILDTGEYEFITFTPTGIIGIPSSPQIGETYSSQITGELTIRDITHEITFEVVAVVNSETNLSGYASSFISREAYDLKIPTVPNVADVDEEVLVEIEFSAAVK